MAFDYFSSAFRRCCIGWSGPISLSGWTLLLRLLFYSSMKNELHVQCVRSLWKYEKKKYGKQKQKQGLHIAQLEKYRFTVQIGLK